MKIFVTGASGFVGSAVVRELLSAGHAVTGLARSDTSAAAIDSAGATVVRGSLGDHDTLQRAAAESDGVIHTAHNHDWLGVSREDAAAEDAAAIEAMGNTLEGSGRPFLTTSGISAPTENEESRPDYPRHASEQATVGFASRGVRSAVIRLPVVVHGEGDEHGFIPMLIDIARATGKSVHIGDGENRWPAVHRSDAALVFRLVLEGGSAGSRYHAAAETGVATKDIATTIGRALDVPIVPKTAEQAADHFGFLARLLALDIEVSSELTCNLLDWRPTQPGLIEDLGDARYFNS